MTTRTAPQARPDWYGHHEPLTPTKARAPWGSYALAILFPLAGAIRGIVLLVADKHRSISRHGIGVILTAVLAAGIYTGIGVTLASSHQDTNVRADLIHLLNSKTSGTITDAQCVHQSGNQYTCQITGADGSHGMWNVTDDGHNIAAQPIR